MARTTMADQNYIKFTQAIIVAWIIVAGAVQAPGLILILAAVLSASAASPSRSLFRLVYQRVAVPLHIVRPRFIPDDPAPHRFAQGMGGAVLTLAALSLLVEATTLGWVLAGLVAALALLNVAVGFCAGCFIHYQLSRRGWLPRRPQGA